MSLLLERMDRLITERSLLKHPFYEMWSAGELSIQSLAGYSKEYFQLVKAVPGFMDAIMEAVPRDTADHVRAGLAENRQEEHDHIVPWIEFAGELGVPETDLAGYAGLAKTRQAVAELGSLMGAAAGFDAGATAMYAFEKEIPLVSQTKLDGLASFYDMTGERATRYFELHTEADIRHAALWRDIIEDSDAARDPEGTRASELLDVASRSVAAQNLLLDACYEGYCTGSGNSDGSR